MNSFLPYIRCGSVSLSPLARSLWAKADPVPKSLWHHMLDTGMCASCLMEEARFHSAVSLIAELLKLNTSQAKRLIVYLAANHDGYGKASPAFQKKVPALAKPFLNADMISIRDQAHGFRHERYGARRYEKEAERFHIPALPARIFASTIEWHHQGKVGEAKNPKRSPEKWDALGNELHAAIIQVFDPPLNLLRTCLHCDAAVMTLLPLVILSDWLASSAPFSRLDESMEDSAYLSASYELAQKVVRQDGLISEKKFPVVSDYRQLWPSFSDSMLRPVQQAVLRQAKADAGLTIIEAPMIVLLSATLTIEKRQRLVSAYGGTLEEISDAYPLITQVKDDRAFQIPVEDCAKKGVCPMS